MAKKTKINNGNYTTYEDQQSLGETHDMLVKALPGQSYVKEPMHKVNTSQVTGEALKKVSVGGKGGFGSQGDARDQAKQVEVKSRVMVMSDPTQEGFDRNASCEKICIGFDEAGKPIYLKQGESVAQRRYIPSHLFGDNKNIKGWVDFTKSHGRDYDEFAHSNDLDPSDHQATCEFYLSGERLDKSRELYDELCGYKGAWKYVGQNGGEHRRYTIQVYNTLNFDTKSEKKSVEVKGTPYWTDEHSTSRHHKDLHLAANKLWRDGDEEAFDKWMMDSNNDHGYYVMWFLGKLKDYGEQTRIYDEPIAEPSEEFLAMKAEAEELERKRKFEAFKHAPKLEDWRIVYKWELTKQGKIMFTNEKI